MLSVLVYELILFTPSLGPTTVSFIGIYVPYSLKLIPVLFQRNQTGICAHGTIA